MSVHYKFKSSKDFDTVTFEGAVISVADLKREIIRQQKLGKANDFDLEITNAQTNEEFKEDNYLIPKNTSVIVKRVPATRPHSHYSKPETHTAPTTHSTYQPLKPHSASDAKAEEDKIQEFLNSGSGYPTEQQRPPYRPNRYGENKPPPPNYICHRCSSPGHFINNCPTNGDPAYDFHKVKKATGIPRAFLKPVENGASGTNDTMMIPGGGIVVMQPNSGDFDRYASSAPAERKASQVPNHLECLLCKNLLRDAVLIPCCANNFCDSCIRSALLESVNMTCPICKKSNQLPGNLTPNMKLRSQVDQLRRSNVSPPQNSTVARLPPQMPNGQGNPHYQNQPGGNFGNMLNGNQPQSAPNLGRPNPGVYNSHHSHNQPDYASRNMRGAPNVAMGTYEKRSHTGPVRSYNREERKYPPTRNEPYNRSQSSRSRNDNDNYSRQGDAYQQRSRDTRATSPRMSSPGYAEWEVPVTEDFDSRY